MNIVFFASSQFAVPSLKALLATTHHISCVVTQPDRKKGRGLPSVATVVKAVALENNLKIYQPAGINVKEAAELLKELNPDLFIVIAYGQILSQEILNTPGILSMNVHASILPKYRGAAPINWAIINGEKSTGVTIIKMTPRMDAGPIILQEAMDISEDDTAVTLEEKLSYLAGQLLLGTLKCIKDNSYNLASQDESEVSFAPKLKKEDGLIKWRDSAFNIYNLIRGCAGWPAAFTYYKGGLLKVHKAALIPSVSTQDKVSPGEIIKVSPEGIIVSCGKDNLIIEELQIEGKRKMGVKDFICGHKISSGEILG